MCNFINFPHIRCVFVSVPLISNSNPIYDFGRYKYEFSLPSNICIGIRDGEADTNMKYSISDMYPMHTSRAPMHSTSCF